MVAAQPATDAGWLRVPARWKRPKAFPGVIRKRERPSRTSPLDWLSFLWEPLAHLVEVLFQRPASRWVGDPLTRALSRFKDSNPLESRRRDDIAKGLSRAMFPRARVSPRTVLEYTDQRLRLVYRHSYREGTERVQLTELGWETPVSNLRWIRQRRNGGGSLYEFGFADGSWTSVFLLGVDHAANREEWRNFVAAFPARLRLDSDENPSRSLAKSLQQEWRSNS